MVFSLKNVEKTIGFIVFVLRNIHKICLIIQKRSSRYRCVSKIASPEALNNFTPETYRNARTHAQVKIPKKQKTKVIESQTIKYFSAGGEKIEKKTSYTS